MKLQSAIVHAVLSTIYHLCLAIVSFTRHLPRRSWQPTGCILVTGTFYNPNWFHSHAQPLARCGMKKVLFVTDTVHEGVENVIFMCPPQWLSRVMSRALAKFVWMFYAGLRYKPDIYIGFHLFPSAISALIMASIFNRRACYQMCAGPIEVIGGGIACENALLTKLSQPSKVLETLALKLLRHFDLIAVRGQSARTFLLDNGVDAHRIAIIPGSIKLSFVGGQEERKYDIVFVGRLAEIKQPLQLVEIIHQVKRSLPAVRAAIVGEGPLSEEMHDAILNYGMADSVEMLGKRHNVEEILGMSRIFLLTSRNEGLSIAMAEGMASGAVPVVANVGDLADLVEDDANGYLVEPNNISSYTERIISVLNDPDSWARLSHSAIQSARRHNGLDVVSQHWKRSLLCAIEQRSDSDR